MAELKCNEKNRYNNHLNLIDHLHKTDFDSKIICFTGVNYFLCRQRALVGNVLPSSGTCQLGMFDIQATTKSKYYDHIVLLYLESRRCRYRSIVFVCFYLYVSVVNLIDYSDIYKTIDINNDKC